MTDWTAGDLLAGKSDSDEEARRKCAEAMADPESVSLVVVGRNGHRVEYRIGSHERTRLELRQSFDQEVPPDHAYLDPRSELWAPRWKRFTWEIEQRFDYRVSDFLGH